MMNATPFEHKQGDPYENLETRPGITEKQKEVGRCAYAELLEAHARWAAGTLLGSRFPQDFREQGGTMLLNQQINIALLIKTDWLIMCMTWAI